MKILKDFMYKMLTILTAVVLGIWGSYIMSEKKSETVLPVETVMVEKQGENQESPTVAITFDDGPSSETISLLKGLKEKGVKATFFITGENIPGHTEELKQMAADGHLIGNHSYSHKELNKLSSKEVKKEMEKTSQALLEITGNRPMYVRPPYGIWKKEMDTYLDMLPVLWNVDSLDWKLKDTNKIVERVLKQVKDGDIILMHDGYPTSTEAAMILIERLKEQGYEFVTVDEMIIP